LAVSADVAREETHRAPRSAIGARLADDGGYVHDAYDQQIYDPDNLFNLNQNIPPR
jgi:hypothetical protein